MKRFFENNKHELDDLEREQLWQDIRRDTPPADHPHPGRRAFRPALGLTTALAAVVVLILWLGNDAPLPDTPVAHRAVEAPSTFTVTGRVIDKDTGDPLANANIVVEGKGRNLVSDSEGRFQLDRLVAGEKVDLRVKYMGYEDEVAQLSAEAAKAPLEIGMEPVILASVEAIDVDEAEYMVEVRSADTEHTVSSETFEEFAIESVEDALSKEAGVVSRAGELYVRGGRSQDQPFQDPGQTKAGGPSGVAPKSVHAPAPEPTKGSVTGGTTAPNGDPYELMYFDHTGVNPFVATEDDSLSTFAVDVDNASYTVARNYLIRGHLPPADAIRVEEFVNYFDPGLPAARDEVFGLNLDGAVSAYGEGYHLLRVGLQGMDVEAADRKPATLIFVVDISGSMDMENRLGLVKQSLHILLDELGEGDRVGLVVYGSRGEVRLEPTDVSRRETLVAAIDGLHSGGATNAHEGLKLAYDLARREDRAGRVNRLILCTDGVANMGRTQAEAILKDVRREAGDGVTLSAIGFGMGNYNDVLLETLSNEGDGNYYYVDRLDEARRVFKENLTGLLQTIARQVKTQVAFDPRYVQRWRLLGYENRDVADRDFRNDAVDAGEVGAGHRVTALYEVKLVNLPDDGDVTLGRAQVRFEFPVHDTERAGQVKEISRDIQAGALTGGFDTAGARLRLQAVAAEFAEILRGSFWARESDLNALAEVADAVAVELEGDADAAELADLVRKAAALQPDEPVTEGGNK